MAGGVEKVLQRAQSLKAEGNLRLACHIVEYAVLAEPSSSDVHAIRAEIYAARCMVLA